MKSQIEMSQLACVDVQLELNRLLWKLRGFASLWEQFSLMALYIRQDIKQFKGVSSSVFQNVKVLNYYE